MSGICAIYSGSVQSTTPIRQTILSLSSKSFRNHSQIHVRRGSICAQSTTQSKLILNCNRNIYALSTLVSSKLIGEFSIVVSIRNQ